MAKKRTTKPTEHDIEAEFLPSASGFDAEFRCLGRRALTLRLPKVEDTVIQRAGQRIHKALEESDLEKLSDSDAKTASRCMYAESKLVHDFDFEGCDQTLEVRFWDVDDELNHLWSARIDTLMTKPRRLLVADNKTGWGIPPPIEINWQVRSSAALLADAYYDVDEAVCALIHPHHPDSLYEVRVFTRDDLNDLLATTRRLVKAIQQPDQPRTPGGMQCQYCEAKGICPEYKAQMDELEQRIADEIKDEGFTALIRQTPIQRGEAVRRLRELEKNIGTLMEQYVQMAQRDGTAIKGYTLRRNMNREIVNEDDAMNAIRTHWGEDMLYDVLHISLTGLEKALAKKMGTAKEAKEAVRRVLNPMLRFKPTKYFLDETRKI